jgi:hypothetical protein
VVRSVGSYNEKIHIIIYLDQLLPIRTKYPISRKTILMNLGFSGKDELMIKLPCSLVASIYTQVVQLWTRLN